MSNTENQLFGLNKQQQTGVDHNNGPMLVVAGAGTGKTTVIVERIARLIKDGSKPDSILALTFTEKAANEMLDRTNDILDNYYLQIPIMTFNSFGESLLRKYSTDIGLNKNFKLIGDDAQIVFMRERLDQLNLDYYSPISNPDGLLGDLSDYFSKLKQNVITPKTYNTFVDEMPSGDESEKLEKSKHQELSHAYDKYIQLCKESGVIDYDDQIYLLIELLQLRPNVLREVQNQYEYVMVDEFQDTNVMQSTLIDLIINKSNNLFVVGDDDQSIYGWRGATLSNILDFKKRYPKTSEVTLTSNYRSTNEILDTAYKLIQHNNPHRLEEILKINKKLVGGKNGEQAKCHVFETNNDELEWIANDISKKLKIGTNPGTIAVLTRRNKTIERLLPHLEELNIPYSVSGQRYQLYDNSSVRILTDAISTSVVPQSNIPLYNTLTSKLFEIPLEDITKYSYISKKQHMSLFDVIESNSQNISPKLKHAIDVIKSWHQATTALPITKLAFKILDESGYKDYINQNAIKEPEVAENASRISEFFKTLSDFERISINPTPIQYLEALPALIASDNGTDDDTLDLSGETINILTIHKSKGLEWDNVYIIDCTEGSFPLKSRPSGISIPTQLIRNKSEADEHYAEERRLMYVAITRAKNNLLLTRAKKHSTKSERKPSRFLAEAIGEENNNNTIYNLPKKNSKIEFFNPLIPKNPKLPSSILKGNTVYLSVSQIASYLNCPLNFYYSYVLDMPEEPKFSMQYGTLMHKILELLNNGVVVGTLPTFESLQHMLIQEWPKEGFESIIHKDRALAQAEKTLKSVYEIYENNPAKPIGIEQSFKVKIPEHNTVIHGKIDVVVANEKGVEIIDYKTGMGGDTVKKAKQKASTSVQLTYYALAWSLMNGELPALSSLQFIDTDTKGSVKKSQKGLDTAMINLGTIANEIRAGKFETRGDHRYCIHPKIK